MDMYKLPLLRGNDPLLFQNTSSMPVAGRMLPCLLCGKPFIMPQFIGQPDQVCATCRKDYDELARLVCSRCRVTIGRVHPGVIDCGYYIRPRSTLHVDSCNICNPNAPISNVREILEWETHYRPKKTFILPTFINRG